MKRHNKKQMRHIFSCSAMVIANFALSAIPTTGLAHAQKYPERTIKIVVAGPPAGGTDYLTRLIGEKLSGALSQTVMVENRAGASGLIGTKYVKQEKPDGYTLLMGHAATNAILPLIHKQPTYDPVNDFTPISLVATAPEVLVVANASPIRSVADLIEMARQKPGEVSYGTPGVGQPQHVLAERFSKQASINLLHIPYNGSGPGLNDLIGGRLTSMFVTPGAVMPFIRDGRVRALAVSSSERSKLLPEVPTLEEAGLIGLHQIGWFGVFSPAHLPDSIVTVLNRSIKNVLADPKVQAQVTASYLEPVGSTSEAFAEFQIGEVAKFKKIIQDLQLNINE